MRRGFRDPEEPRAFIAKWEEEINAHAHAHSTDEDEDDVSITRTKTITYEPRPIAPGL